MKYPLGTKVLIKPLNTPGVVVGWTCNYGPFDEFYKVAYKIHNIPYYYQGFNVMEYLGPRTECLKVRESALGPINPAESHLKCECGMEKHGFANHTSWCPKF